MSDEKRVNAGYVITDSVHIGAVEFVLGESATAPDRYVTWECKDGSDYYWGHYMSDRAEAERDLLRRASGERQFKDRQLEQKTAQKSREEKEYTR